MPWDPTNVKVFDTQRPQKIALDTVRSGCYKRAVAILQSTERTGTQQATAESLHRLLQAAGAENIQAEIPEQDAQFLYQEQVNAEAARQDKLQAKANKQQLRRERQQRRHEQKMAVRQQRYDDKVKARQKDFKQQISKRRTQQESSLQQLKEQQRSLQEQLADHQQSSAQLLNSAPVESSEHALAALQKELQDAQTSKAQAEEQLQLVRNSMPLQAFCTCQLFTVLPYGLMPQRGLAV